jgi:hypothetical protein
MSILAAIALTTLTVSSTTTLSREQKYRQAAILNAAAADQAKADFDACALELAAERRILPMANQPAEAPTPVILYGIAGVGIGLVIGVVATLAAMKGTSP